MNIYQENGYESRKHYLQCLAEDYDLDYKDVVMLATTLGKSEDFRSEERRVGKECRL